MLFFFYLLQYFAILYAIIICNLQVEFCFAVLVMAGKIGSIDPYNESEEDFDSYCSRVEMYFVANDVKDEKKVAAFLTLAGPKVFCLVQDLLSPRKPEDSSYSVILETLRKHFKPKPVIIYEH